MTNLKAYLTQKREALLKRRAKIDAGELGPSELKASTSAEGRSGVRRIRIRDFQIISDSGPDFAGYNLGPSSPEILVGALTSCLTHTWLIHASDKGLELETVDAEARATIDPRAGSKGHESVPVYPHDFTYTVTVVTAGSAETVAEVAAAVERLCPILNLLKQATNVNGTIIHKQPETLTANAA